MRYVPSSLVDITPSGFERYGVDGIARTISYLHSKLPPTVAVILRNNRIFLEFSLWIKKEDWIRELETLASYEPQPCPCGCEADLVISPCRQNSDDRYLTQTEKDTLSSFVKDGLPGQMIEAIQLIRSRTGLPLSRCHKRALDFVKLLKDHLNRDAPGCLTKEECAFVHNCVLSGHLRMSREPAEVGLTRLAIAVGQRAGLERAFANVHAYAEFVRQTIPK